MTSAISFDIPIWLSFAGYGLLGLVVLFNQWLILRRPPVTLPIFRRAVWLILMIQVLVIVVSFVDRYVGLGGEKLGPYLLPPKNPFLIASAFRQLQTVLAGWVVTLFFFLLMSFSQRRFPKRLVLETDLAMFLLGLGAVGWPANLIFLALTFFITAVGMSILLLFRRRNLQDRLVISPFIIVATLLTLALKPWLLSITHLSSIRF